MRRLFLAVYLGVPALVFLTIGVGRGELVQSDPSFLAYLLPNYLIFAGPQLIWFLIARVRKPANYTWHAGFLGASLALVSLHISFECCVGNENSLGWLYYWPLAITLMVVLVGVPALFKFDVKQKRA
jgi:hypothetical protein